MKEIVRKLLRFVMTPLRCHYQRVNGVEGGETRKEIPNDVLLGLAREMIAEGHTATINVKGYSMRPFLEHQRDKVRLEACPQVRDYDAVLAEVSPGHYVLHRVIAIDGEIITLMGDGNIRGTEHCLSSDIAGIVTEYIRPNRVIKASDKKLQFQLRLWRKLLPVRRYLLIFYKALL